MVEPTPAAPRSGSRFAIGVLIVAAGIALLLGSLDVDVPWRVVGAVAVTAAGVLLLVAPRTSVRGGLVVLGVVLTAILAATLGGEARNIEQADLTVTEPVTRIVVDIDSGSVAIVAGGSTVEVKRELRFGDDRPSVEARVEGDVLRIESDCPSTFLSSCRVDHSLTVPEGISITVETGSGSIDVDGLSGSVNVHSGSGRIDLRRLRGAVTVDASSGSVDLEDLSGDVDVQTGSGSISGGAISSATFVGEAGSGSITLDFEEGLARLDLSTGSGSVQVTVPGGAYRLDLRSSSGSTGFSGVSDDPSAPRTISIHTGSGSVRVTGARS